MTALASILLIVSLLFGGAGATVYAAQNSAPDQALYSVKMWSENARLDLASGPQAQLELALEYANRRAQEAVNQFQAGAVPSTAVQQRWQDQLSLAMKVAAGMPDKDMRPALQQIQASVQDQLRDMDRLHLTGDPDQIRQHLQIMLQDCLNKINLGQQQPAQFREQSRQGWKNFAPTAQPSQSAGGGNPWTTGTPTPGSSYGSGNGSNPWTTGTPTPGSGYGPGSSQNPWTTGTPVPGSSYGPGPGTGATCTPGSGPGPNPAQPQVQPTSGKNPGNGGQPTSLPSSGGPRKP